MIFFYAQIRATKKNKARRSGLTLNVDPTPPYGGKYKWRMSARAYLRTPRLISERDVHFLMQISEIWKPPGASVFLVPWSLFVSLPVSLSLSLCVGLSLARSLFCL